MICNNYYVGCRNYLDVDILTGVLIVITGTFVGLLGGMFGFGGSSITTPLLRIIFLVPPYQALASPLPMTLLSSSISTKKYHTAECVEWDIVKKMVIVMVIGSFLGAYATKYMGGKILMLLTAIFLMYMALRLIFSWRMNIKSISKLKVMIAGFFIGLLSGMLANGGGILIVPILMLLGLDIKKAIGTSVAIVFFVAIPSILVHWYLGHIDWWLTLLLSIGTIPGAYGGAHITIKMEKDKVRKLYGIFILLFALYFAIFEIFGIG